MAMTQYEQFCDTAYAQLIDVFEHALPERVRGLYYEDEMLKVITINKDMETMAEKLCVLVEELGHSIYGGNLVLGLIPDNLRRKYERQARVWAYKKLLPAKKLIRALQDPYYINNLYEIAEDFDVTEEFLTEAIEHYQTTGTIPTFNNWDEAEYAQILKSRTAQC